MVEKAERSGGEHDPRAADGRRFEVFVREEEPDPLRHVGTVRAPGPDVAHEKAGRLFAWYARDVWVCPAEETHRYSTGSLEPTRAENDSGRDDDEAGQGDDSRDDEGGRVDDGEDADENQSGEPGTEPRVYEETEGTPTVACGGVPSDGCEDGVDEGEAGVDEGEDGVNTGDATEHTGSDE